MKRTRRIAFPSLLVAGLALSVCATAQNRQLANYSKIATITVPGNLAGGFDISWVDSTNQRYYLADRATKGTGRIDVIDTRTNTFLYSIPQTKGAIGFVGVVGPGRSGPNGVVAIPQINQLYVGDGDSTVKVVDLTAKAVVAVIQTGGKFRADELAYDPVDHIIMITNPNDSPPFLSFISTDTQTVLGTLAYSADQSGLEQPVWNGQLKKFMISVPASASRTGEVDVIDPIAMQVTSRFFLNCSPAGLALGPLQRVMTSCAQVIDARNGNTYAYSQGQGDSLIGGDEIWFNPGDNRYYFGSGNVGVVDAETYLPLGFLATGVPTHSIAVDSQNNHIFVPATGIGVQVYAQTGP
jgi:DNA-binding beta-propeller fold protein YncE